MKRKLSLFFILLAISVLMITLTACFEVEPNNNSNNTENITITFDTKGGTEISPIVLKSGETITMPTNPTKAGYTFNGWDKTIPQVMPDENMTITVNWAVNSYIINYHIFSGITNPNLAKSYYTIEDDTYKLIAPTSVEAIEGYQDNNYKWFVFTDGEKEEITEITKGTFGELDIYLGGTPIEYSIVYNNMDGIENTKNPNIYTIEDNITFAVPEKSGYAFLGWFSEAGFENEVLNIISGDIGNLELYAKWEVVEYDINYHLVYGMEETENPNILKTNYTIEDEEYVFIIPTGEVLDGFSDNIYQWYGDVKKTEIITKIDSGKTGNLDLYLGGNLIAYNITYCLNGGTNSENNPTIFTVADNIELKNPTNGIILKDNKIYNPGNFEGWYEDSSFTKPIATIDSGTISNILIFAKWEEPTLLGNIADQYVRVDNNNNVSEDGDYLYFGTYPQSLKASEVSISTNEVNANGYYVGSDDCEYVKIVANLYLVNAKSTIDFDGNEIVNGNIYYFKVEPIKWRILSIDDGEALILCENIIDNGAFVNKTNYEWIDINNDELANSNEYFTTKDDEDENNFANNWKYSDYREYLNDDFYNLAFNNMQSRLIVTNQTETDVSDNIYLLDKDDIINSDYGFSSVVNYNDILRQKQISDYGYIKGGFMNNDTDSDYYKKGWWYLRSPDYSGSKTVDYIMVNGNKGSLVIDSCEGGMAPALKIMLNSRQEADKYTVSYISGEGDGTAPIIPNQFEDSLITLIENPFIYENHKFVGWTDGVTIYNVDDVFTIGDNVVFTAIWEEDIKFTITYNNGGGVGDDPIIAYQYENANYILINNSFTYEYHNFGGWSDGTTLYAEGDSYIITKNVTFTATWILSASIENVEIVPDNSVLQIDGTTTNVTFTANLLPNCNTYQVIDWYINDVCVTSGTTNTYTYSPTINSETRVYAIVDNIRSDVETLICVDNDLYNKLTDNTFLNTNANTEGYNNASDVDMLSSTFIWKGIKQNLWLTSQREINDFICYVLANRMDYMPIYVDSCTGIDDSIIGDALFAGLESFDEAGLNGYVPNIWSNFNDERVILVKSNVTRNLSPTGPYIVQAVKTQYSTFLQHYVINVASTRDLFIDS
ncbi:MAG: InlB B-repeat-containing protein [Clostridia bacterium]